MPFSNDDLFELIKHIGKSLNMDRVEIIEMTEEQAFLAAIEKDPSNQAHKLIYADWLDEQSRNNDADAMRWLAVKEKCIVRNEFGVNQRYYWTRIEIHPTACNLPDELFLGLEKSIVVLPWPININKSYQTFEEGILAFFQAWSKATAQPSWFWRLFGYQAWVPDYSDSLSERFKKIHQRMHTILEQNRQSLKELKECKTTK